MTTIIFNDSKNAFNTEISDGEKVYIKYTQMINYDTFNANEFKTYCESFLYSGFDIDILFLMDKESIPKRNVKLCEILWKCYNTAIHLNVKNSDMEQFIYHNIEDQCRINFTITICETALKILYPNDTNTQIGGLDTLNNKNSYIKFIEQIYEIFFIHMKGIEDYIINEYSKLTQKQIEKTIISKIH